MVRKGGLAPVRGGSGGGIEWNAFSSVFRWAMPGDYCPVLCGALSKILLKNYPYDNPNFIRTCFWKTGPHVPLFLIAINRNVAEIESLKIFKMRKK